MNEIDIEGESPWFDETDLGKNCSWLQNRPELEEELKIEVELREILNEPTFLELKFLVAALYKENWIKDHLIKNCLGHIGTLEGELYSIMKEQKK